MIMIARPPLVALLLVLAALVLSTCPAWSQSVPVQSSSPAYRGFRLPSASGTLHYSLSATERASIGNEGENQTQYGTGISGNLAFITQSVLYPTSVTYSGGYVSGSGSGSSNFFQSALVSQSIKRKYSSITVTDSLSYLPEAPSVGLAGLAGLGDLGASPNPTTTQGLLTEAPELTNMSSVQYTRRLTGSTSVGAQGNYFMQRFLGDSTGLKTDSYAVGAQFQHRIDARSSVGAQYTYSVASYPGFSENFNFQSAVATYNRSLTRQLAISVGAGPEIIGSSIVTNGATVFDYRLMGSLTYSSRSERGGSLGIAFTRGTTGGQGASYGGESDSLSATANRTVGRSLGLAAAFAYSKTGSLDGTTQQSSLFLPSVNANAYTASTQANRAIGRSFSAYVSYTFQRQSYLGDSQGISPLNGIVQTIAFGITYSPESIHLGRQ